MPAKDNILKAAIQLFNQQGTAPITTNHIAREAGVSPGNLYYHFKNKADIIRALYMEMAEDWNSLYAEMEGQVLSAPLVRYFVEVNFKLLWKYRFFYRETVALIQADPELAAHHLAVTERGISRQRQMLEQGVREGLFHFPASGASMEQVLTIVWIIANHYLIHLESMGQKVDQTDFEKGAELVMAAFKPYQKQAG